MKCKLFFISVSLGTALMSYSSQAAMRQYSANQDNSNWEVIKTTRLQCQLNHEVPYYGEAIFRHRPVKTKT